MSEATPSLAILETAIRERARALYGQNLRQQMKPLLDLTASLTAPSGFYDKDGNEIPLNAIAEPLIDALFNVCSPVVEDGVVRNLAKKFTKAAISEDAPMVIEVTPLMGAGHDR